MTTSQTQPVQDFPQAPAAPAPVARPASLWVGDLNRDVTEPQLYELFNSVGPVLSIRVCRHSITRQSLGYAYVNFHNAEDAERVLNSLNYTPINGRACRIMWSQRDPTLRRSNKGNVFVKNLPASFDSRDLHDLFSACGNILSCKIATDANGNSKGFGFVHFDDEAAAQDAISRVDGISHEDHTLKVETYRPPNERKDEDKWTNVYSKDFPLTWSEDDLRKQFGEKGEVTSVFLPKDKSGASKGFAFVNFATHEAASRAVDELHGKELTWKRTVKEKNENGEVVGEKEVEVTKPMYVSPAQQKDQRQRKVQQQLEETRAERVKQMQGRNVYVRNLDETVDEEDLKKFFSTYGPITSVRIPRGDNGRSKLFGYVLFQNAEDADKAIQRASRKMLNNKPLYVTLWQPKSLRQTALQAQFQGQAGAMGVAPGMNNMYMNMLMNRVPMPGMGRGGMPMPMNMAQQRGFSAFGVPPMMQMPQQVMMQQQQQQQQAGGRGGGRGGRGGARAQAHEMPQTGAMAPQPQTETLNSQNAMFDPQTLANLSQDQQKQVIGERLYGLIQSKHGERAGKITGMLLDGMDTSELLHLLESPTELHARIGEALDVLEEFERKNAGKQ